MASPYLATPLLGSTAAGRLLGALHAHGSMTRSEVTSVAGLAPSAAGKAVEDLERLCLLESHQPLPGGRGRPSPILEIRHSGGVAIACVLSREGLQVAVVNLGRQILHRESEAFNVTELSATQTLSLLARRINRVLRSVTHRCVGIALSVPGLFNQQTGVAEVLLPLGWRNVPVTSFLARSLPPELPLLIAHDATLGALAEFRTGAGRGAQRLLFLSGERVGVGSALIVADEESGRSDHSLQAGHLVVDPHGPSCTCGARGCLELFIDGRAIARAMGLPETATSQEIRQRLATQKREPGAKPSLTAAMKHLEVGLISLVNTLAPDRVVLSGLLSDLAAIYSARVASALRLSILAQVAPVTLVNSTLEDGLLLGASELAFEPLLRDPEGLLERVIGRAPTSQKSIGNAQLCNGGPQAAK